MEASVTAAITPAGSGVPSGEPGPTMGRTRAELPSGALPLGARNVSESVEEGLGSEDFAETSSSASHRMRALPGRRPRKPAEPTFLSLRTMAGVLALAVVVATAVSTLYGMASCLQGTLRGKGNKIRFPGVWSRRLAGGDEAGDESPPYEEAIRMPVVASPVPLAPRSGFGGAPPPSYDEVCGTQISAGLRAWHRRTRRPEDRSVMSFVTSHQLELIFIGIWFSAVVIGILSTTVASLGQDPAVLLVLAVGMGLSVAVLVTTRATDSSPESEEEDTEIQESWE